MKFIATTVESGEIYRVCEKTGEVRTVEVATVFGAGNVTQSQVKVWAMLHPDDPAEEKLPSPYGGRPVGVGKFIGLEWV
jgi:hypothetical protein